jgi:peptide chain release factor subunit 1
MAAPSLTRGRLRRLAELRTSHGRVLSVFLNLDPSQFATAPARATATNSLLTEAHRRVEECTELDHDEHQALRADLERVRGELARPDLATGGTKGVAVYACSPADLFEVVRLPHPIESRVIIDPSPSIEPLVLQGAPERWGVLLANRRCARILLGSSEGFEEVGRVDREIGTAEYDHGGSQLRNEHASDEETRHHLQRVADELFLWLQRQPFDRLLLGTPSELHGDMVERLHPYLRDRVAGRISVDVESFTADQVRDAAAPLIDEDQRTREREALDRLAAGLGRGERAVAGLADTLQALNELRVELLFFEEGFHAAGMVEASTGILAVDGGTVPVEEPALEPREDVLEPAIERAIEQSADVMAIRRYPDLGSLGGIAAILRF